MFESNDQYNILVYHTLLMEENRERTQPLLERRDVKNAVVSFIMQNDYLGFLYSLYTEFATYGSGGLYLNNMTNDDDWLEATEMSPPIIVYIARGPPLTTDDITINVISSASRVGELSQAAFTFPIVMIFCNGVDDILQDALYPSASHPGLLQVDGDWWVQKCLMKFVE